MQDTEKTKELLVAELAAARRRIADLEAGEAERERARDALVREQKFTQALLASLPGIFYLYTYPELRLVRWNTNHEKFLGYAPGEIANRSLTDWHPPELLKPVLRAVETVMTKGHDTVESPLLTKDGRLIPFLMTGSRFEVQGETYLMGVGIDITESKHTEEALRKSEASVRLLVEHAPDAIFIQSEGRFVYLNQATLKLFGARSAEDLVGAAILDRIHADSRESVRERISAVNEEREPLPVVEERYLRLDGTVVEVEVAAVPFVFEGKHGGLVFVRDITERKRSEKVMVHNERMMTVGGLAAGMAHEINNPLGGILQSLQNIRRRLSPGLPANEGVALEQGCSLEAIGNYLRARQVPEFLDAIEQSGKRATRIVANMLEFSRKGISGKKLVDVNEVVEKSLSFCLANHEPGTAFDFRNIVIERDFDQGDPKVPGIPSQIEQVLVNLLQNAMQALEDRPDKASPAIITVRTRGEAEAVRLEVADNGPGMKPEVLRRVFDPFFTTKPVGKGTGLGLSVSYFIVINNHGGALEVESTPGKGSRFIVRLPLHRPQTAAAGGSASA
jgi:PAS domain S-box-containing protein